MAAKAIGILGGATLWALALLLLDSTALANDAADECGAKPYVVKIHADWCGSCKALESVWERIETDLAMHRLGVRGALVRPCPGRTCGSGGAAVDPEDRNLAGNSSVCEQVNT